MATITSRKVKGHAYYYAVQSKRINGQPRLVLQKYLGSADDIINAVDGYRKPNRPKKVHVFSFGGVAAAWAMAQRLRLIEIIDQYASKRDQGISVGQYITLAAVNRCTAPTSKLAFAQWYASTSLARINPVPQKLLAPQRFWDHMHRLDDPLIQRIEQDLSEHVVKEFKIDLRTLAYDTTNFFTYIDTFNDRNTLGQRGKSKEHRADLRIVGLALLVSMDFHVPLFHQTYPGNQHDSKTFGSITDELVQRYRLLSEHCSDITLVFDKGNNSTDNIAAVEQTPYHFVGSLPYDQHPKLLDVPDKQFHELTHPRLQDAKVYRTRIPVMGVERTVLVVYNQNLYLTQLQTIADGMAKRCAKLRVLQDALRKWANGSIKGGNKPTAESLKKRVDKILTGQHMKTLIKTEVHTQNHNVKLTYRCPKSALASLARRVLGKTILFTDNHSWTDEQIILAYRGQSHIEDAFRSMKNLHFISIRPMYHWTDPMIRVHAFYCVLALTIASLLVRELHHKGIQITIPRLFETLNAIEEVALIWPTRPGRPSAKTETQLSPSLQLSDMNPDQLSIVKALKLRRLAPPVV